MKMNFRKSEFSNIDPKKKNKWKRMIGIELAGLLVLSLFYMCSGENHLQKYEAEYAKMVIGESTGEANGEQSGASGNTEDKKDYIKYAECNVTYEALCKAYELALLSHEEKMDLSMVELLAYGAAKHGGEFPKKVANEMQRAYEEIKAGKTTLSELTKDMEYYTYYFQVYEAIFSGFVGEYEKEVVGEDGMKEWVKGYGLIAYSPIAKGFDYSDYDDFGSSRSYGYKRVHLGHDMVGQIGTPIIAVESGTVEALGWNQYGGWRIGIRTDDKKRYYYYAHLRQNYPYAEGLKEGDYVTAGDVIGYMGHTGYSAIENTNNIEVVHLHLGLELIFDEAQKECDNEIWVDCYAITKFLLKNRSQVEKIGSTREWRRTTNIRL